MNNKTLFEQGVDQMNAMYKLPMPAVPGVGTVIADEKNKMLWACDSKEETYKVLAEAPAMFLLKRLRDFKITILREVDEIEAILDKVSASRHVDEMEILTDLADWFGDMIIYCASEMLKYGIPIEQTLSIIMSSNFSKLQADGSALYDDAGKIEKGPGYWKPEPALERMLTQLRRNAPEQKPSGE